MDKKVACKTEDYGVEEDSVGGRAARHGDLEDGRKLRHYRRNKATDNLVNRLVEHRRAHDKEKDRGEDGMHCFCTKTHCLLFM